MDQKSHRDVISRAAKGTDISVDTMRKAVGEYLHEVAGVLSEADPERRVRLPGLCTLKVKVHDSHTRYDFQKEERVQVPAYRSLKVDASRRLRKTLKLPLKEFYDEYE